MGAVLVSGCWWAGLWLEWVEYEVFWVWDEYVVEELWLREEKMARLAGGETTLV